MTIWKYLASAFAIGSVTFGVKRYFSGPCCRCNERLDGLVVIITGANSGIGRALAFELARRGASLVLACRNVEAGLVLKKEITATIQETKPKIFVKHLDLNVFESIIRFCDDVKSEFEEIYALVNNAGVFYHPQQLTVDNFDVTLQTNYLGPFVLTHHLLSVLKNAAHARIINVVSEAHRTVTPYDLKALTKCQTVKRPHFTAYGVSKLALLLFTNEFSKKLSNTNIIVNAVNPGNVETSIYRNFPSLSNPYAFMLQWPIRFIIIKSPFYGCQSILHSLLTSNRSTGQYISDCKFVLPSVDAIDSHLAKDYYNLTLEVLDNKFITESEC